MSAIQCVIIYGIKEKGETFMAKKKGVSSKTHTQKQLNDYANQNNPNNNAYQARKANKKSMRRKSYYRDMDGVLEPLDWMCYSNPYDFE